MNESNRAYRFLDAESDRRELIDDIHSVRNSVIQIAQSVPDKATAAKFRTILLETGNETDRKEAYKAFRGRAPDVNALFKRRGFPTGN